jgi:hypothetical protein
MNFTLRVNDIVYFLIVFEIALEGSFLYSILILVQSFLLDQAPAVQNIWTTAESVDCFLIDTFVDRGTIL